jgi:riboflavin biosynthesis pyrimidine reductase
MRSVRRSGRTGRPPTRWLLDSHLVDEIALLTYPVIVGQDLRLFPATGPDKHLNWSTRGPPPEG